jgi:hypothetical protein
MKRLAKVFAAGVVACALTGPTPLGSAQSQGKSQEKPEGSKSVGEPAWVQLPVREPAFTEREITLIQDWFRTNRNNLPEWLAKSNSVPADLEKQLEKKATVPSGLQSSLQPLPDALEKQLMPLPVGFRRVVVGGNVILINQVTRSIVDIVRAAIPRSGGGG